MCLRDVMDTELAALVMLLKPLVDSHFGAVEPGDRTLPR
jgi:hypothetical protein